MVNEESNEETMLVFDVWGGEESEPSTKTVLEKKEMTQTNKKRARYEIMANIFSKGIKLYWKELLSLVLAFVVGYLYKTMFIIGAATTTLLWYLLLKGITKNFGSPIPKWLGKIKKPVA